jgi:hypothetical protein
MGEGVAHLHDGRALAQGEGEPGQRLGVHYGVAALVGALAAGDDLLDFFVSVGQQDQGAALAQLGELGARRGVLGLLCDLGLGGVDGGQQVVEDPVFVAGVLALLDVLRVERRRRGRRQGEVVCRRGRGTNCWQTPRRNGSRQRGQNVAREIGGFSEILRPRRPPAPPGPPAGGP